MKSYVVLGLALLVSACATAPNNFDRDTHTWATTIVSCESAAQLGGSVSDKDIWAYEKQALLQARNGGWNSDRARLNNAIKKDKIRLHDAGNQAISQRLGGCNQVVETLFKEGHPTFK